MYFFDTTVPQLLNKKIIAQRMLSHNLRHDYTGITMHLTFAPNIMNLLLSGVGHFPPLLCT